MTLRKKILITIGATFFGLILILYFTSWQILLKNFSHIEEDELDQDVKRTIGILYSELEKLDETTSDWAGWDDTYEFIADHNQEYIESNLIDDTFSTLRLNFMIFVNASGKIVFSKGYDFRNSKEIPIPRILSDEHILQNSPLIDSRSKQGGTKGLLLTPHAILMVVSRPILTSRNEGPARGRLIFGRYLNDAEIMHLARILHLHVTLSRFNDPKISQELQGARGYLSKTGSIFIRPLNDKIISGYTLLRDIYGKPALILQVDKPRVVYKQGKVAVYYFVLFLAGACIVSCIVAMISLDKQALSQLNRISKTVSTIASSGTLTRRIPVQGKDELSLLAKNINDMLDKLEQTQKELKATEKKYRELVENANSIIIRMDTGGKITFFNEFAQAFFGYRESEILGGNVAAESIIHGDECSGRCFMDIVEDMKKHPEPYTSFETEHMLKTGKRVWIAWTGKAICGKEGRLSEFLFVGNEITRQKQMEAELLKVQKLESVGMLAGGIAHDFNNILTAILGNITLAKMALNPDNDKVFQRLDEAEKASIRAKDLTQRLLTFAKGGAPIKKTAQIGDLVRDSTNFVLSGSNVRPIFSIPEDLWPVEIDEGQINQVINNLVINARQAMPEGGTIEVRVENIFLENKEIYPLGKGKYIKITVRDEGTGIPEEHLKSIFDPYFTTKQKGSGLGLAISHSIVKNHNGHIAVESRLGAGTSFHVYLPASERDIPEEKIEAGDLPSGQGRVLVMDDEPAVREVAGNMLEVLGYEVEFAEDGEEAVELYKRNKELDRAFNAVILDLTVPGGMGGIMAIEKLAEIDIQVKAIVSSGYYNDPVISDFKRYGFKGVVTKPYKINELAEVLHRVMKG